MEKVKVFNLIILDESGSMDSIKRPAVEGLNETIQTIRNAQQTHTNEQDHFVTLVVFNSNGIRTIIKNSPINEVREVRYTDYHPNACTPLYDAMGLSLTGLKYQLSDTEKNQVLVTIITDGYENSSKEYDGRMIKKLVKELKSQDWVFVYIGANQDVEAVAGSMEINNTLRFLADKRGINEMMAKTHAARSCFYEKISSKLFDDKVDLQSDFFE
jgi:Mg-chelatase subunit ChlD